MNAYWHCTSGPVDSYKPNTKCAKLIQSEPTFEIIDPDQGFYSSQKRAKRFRFISEHRTWSNKWNQWLHSFLSLYSTLAPLDEHMYLSYVLFKCFKPKLLLCPDVVLIKTYFYCYPLCLKQCSRLIIRSVWNLGHASFNTDTV